LRTDGGWGAQTGDGTSEGTLPSTMLPATGQTISYAPGDDGDIQKGVTISNPRFTDNSDGTVKDNLTGLIWLKNTRCFGNQTWANSLNSANTLSSGVCGLTDGSTAGDWRMPNRFELESLLNMQYEAPALSNSSGTGKWTAVTALDEGTPLTLIGEAVFARILSSLKEQRVSASQILQGPSTTFDGDREQFIANLEQALYAAKIISYTQGYMLMQAAAEAYNWHLNYGGVALMWREGCIIRSVFLEKTLFIHLTLTASLSRVWFFPRPFPTIQSA